MRKSSLFILIIVSCLSIYGKKIEDKEELSFDVIVDSSQFNEGYFERQILRYEELIKEYQNDLRSLIKRDIEEKERTVNEKYGQVLKREEEKELVSRNDAIKLFEEFIKKYPDNSKYTPNAMYRLAELYYERSVIDYGEKYSRYEELQEQYDKKLVKSEPVEPALDFSDTTELYESLIKRFPDFQYIGSVYYMLGYCYAESGNGDKAVKVWLDLIEKKIETTHLAELYMRLGDHYFETNVLDKAEHFYKEGMRFTESDFFDKLLYKYAWTFYRVSRFEEAVNSFTQLLFFADDMKSKGINRGQDLRKEAVQYIAISFSDDEWGSVEKAIEYFDKIKAASFEKEVFEQIGKYYFENNNFDQAEKAYRYILQKHPYYESAPRIHYRLIQLYNKSRDFDKVAKETEIFAKLYDASGEWARINRGNATLVKEATEWAKNSLLDTASFHHRQAQALVEKGEADAAVDEYRIAAIAYGEYLVKFPYTSESYDITYSFADALFRSGDIEMAVVIYERIRDDKNQDRYRDDAAFQAFVCYNTIWNKSSERLVKGEEKRDKPFSVLEEKLIESSDIYFETAKEVEDKPAVAYTVARIFWDHGKFEEAEKRYLKIINEFPESQAAIFGARDIISAYNQKQDWVNVAKWSKLLTERLSVKQKVDKAVKDEFETIRGTALFFYAGKLEEEGKFVEAASEYLRIVEETPYFKEADVALYNAAINFSKATMFESALQIHERVYKEYPYSQFAPKSLYLIAYNAEMSYDHQKAVNAYKLLYEKYPTYEKKNDAIYNAGFLLEKLQKYKEASLYYRTYYSEEKNKFEGKEALYMAGHMYQKAEDWKNMISSYENFISTFRNDSEVASLVGKAYSDIANVYEDKLNNWKMAKEYYKRIVDFSEEKNLKSDEVVRYVSEAKFKLAEDDFNSYLKMRIDGKNEKQLEENLKKKLEAKNILENKYLEIISLQIFEWVTAAIYRRGYLYQSFSDALFEAEPPKGLSEEEEDIYMKMLRDQAAPIEEKAVDVYTQGLEKAREIRSFNKWTQLMTERLSVMRPALYKVGKTPMFAVDKKFNTGYPIIISLDNAEKKQYKKAGIGGVKIESPASEQKSEKGSEDKK
ncbi:MAG TPA: tetratricopeptide repeat protein [bacterium]|nr:tetratricopeptide repeat protein [bacterium]